MNDSEHDNISSEVLTDFGRKLGRPTLDRRHLREVLTATVAQHADEPAIAGLRERGAHYYAVRSTATGSSCGSATTSSICSTRPVPWPASSSRSAS